MRVEETAVIEKVGKSGFAEYRIPAVIVTERGTVLIAYESRGAVGDDWADVRITVRRSVNGGRVFGQALYPHEKIPGWSGGGKRTWNNPVLIADGERIHLIFHQDYERAWHCVSEDEGCSFSEPREITESFRTFPWQWNVCASGPGHGIVTTAGRLLVPVWLAMGEVRMDKDPTGRVKNHFPSVAGCIYSDDHGESWKSGLLTEGVKNANETTLAELGDGRILFNIRHCGEDKCRVLAIAGPELARWERIWSEERLPDPRCFGSMAGEGDRLYFVNCASTEKRVCLTVYESRDDGRTWHPLMQADECGGYADVAAGKGFLYLLYEKGISGVVSELVLKKIRI